MKEYYDNMFYGATASTFEQGKELRLNMTNAEKLLWQRLSKNQINNMRFRRQHPINIYIADFYCHQAKLVVELDGNSHLEEEAIEYDNGRTAFMNAEGIKVLRFYNSEVFTNIEKVIEQIKAAMLSPLQGI